VKFSLISKDTNHAVKFFQTLGQNFHLSFSFIRNTIGKVPVIKKSIPLICENMQLLQTSQVAQAYHLRAFNSIMCYLLCVIIITVILVIKYILIKVMLKHAAEHFTKSD